jgi:DNA processing protein
MSSPDPAFVALGLIRHVGGRTLRALLTAFDGDPRAVLAADAAALRRVPGVGPKIAAAIQAVDLGAVEAGLNRWTAAGVRVIPWDDPAYPRPLRALDDAPPLLFVVGALPANPYRAVAVIGRRRISTATKDLTGVLAGALADAGEVVVSGLAYGVDHAAHHGALSAPGGRTLAVLGGGVLNIYPRDHGELAAGVRARGALLCEVAPDSGVSAAGLVARNRIITGLCRAVFVVETEIDGGAMHAARFARAQGRALYALDCPASGNRALIADGATPVSAAELGAGLAWLRP